jgi:uncharacterized phage protein (TIGR02218 family)
MRFTDSDADITVDGDLYTADRSFQASAIQSAVGGANQNLDILVLFGSGANRVDYHSTMRHVYQGAAVTVHVASHGNPAAGKGLLMAGSVGAVTVPSRLYGKLSIVGGSGKLDRILTEVYTPTCRADFCDVRCGLNIATFGAAFTVTSLDDDMTFDTGLSAADGFYNLGTVVWATGDNANVQQEVAASLSDGSVALFMPARFPIQVGDTGTIARGCAKTIAACVAYGNKPNFRGEPYVPGDDYKQVL